MGSEWNGNYKKNVWCFDTPKPKKLSHYDEWDKKKSNEDQEKNKSYEEKEDEWKKNGWIDYGSSYWGESSNWNDNQMDICQEENKKVVEASSNWNGWKENWSENWNYQDENKSSYWKSWSSNWKQHHYEDKKKCLKNSDKKFYYKEYDPVTGKRVRTQAEMNKLVEKAKQYRIRLGIDVNDVRSIAECFHPYGCLPPLGKYIPPWAPSKDKDLKQIDNEYVTP